MHYFFTRNFLFSLISFTLLAGLWACKEKLEGDLIVPDTNKSTIEITPAGVYVYEGQSVQLSTVIKGKAKGSIVWHVFPDSGSITSEGIYTAPTYFAADSIKLSIHACLLPADTLCGAAEIVLIRKPEPAAQIDPDITRLNLCGKQSFSTAYLQIGGNASYTWTVLSGPGTVTSGGAYTAPESLSADSLPVTLKAEKPGDAKYFLLEHFFIYRSYGGLAAVRATVPYDTVRVGTSLQIGSEADIPCGSPDIIAFKLISGPGTLSPTGLYTAPANLSADTLPVRVLVYLTTDTTVNAEAAFKVFRQKSSNTSLQKCSTATSVSTFPFTATLSTCGKGNDFPSLCGGLSGDGEDIVYALHITAAQTLLIKVTSLDLVQNPEWAVLSDCGQAQTCIDANNVSLENRFTSRKTVTFNTAGTYYLVIQAQDDAKACGQMQVSVTKTTPVDNDLCANAVKLEGQVYNGSTIGFIEEAIAPGFGCMETLENSQWFRFKPEDDDVIINITATACHRSQGDGGIQAQVYRSPSESCAQLILVAGACIGANGTYNGTITLRDSDDEERYYLVIDGYKGDLCNFKITASGLDD
ncbi:MAG: hypothetical protein V4543_13370 [Bacteroidota bacterium]